MPPRRTLTCLECLARLEHRLDRRIDALERVRLPDNALVIAELRNELDLLRRAQRYLRR